MEKEKLEQASTLLGEIKTSMEQVVIGKGEVIDLLLIALISGGHVLIEDVPGLGKTTMASALAGCIGCDFSRIQFTSDTMPSDITGYTIFDMQTGKKEFHKGAVMSQVVLADEINRTSPKTQSALLQAMQEGKVTVDNVTHQLSEPFIVLATQNPIEMTGTYPLPEAQLDRFLLRTSMGYPGKKDELAILRQHKMGGSRKEVRQVCSRKDILFLKETLDEVICQDSIFNYIISIAAMTRDHKGVALGISPRGCIALMRAAMGRALLEGRDYVVPEDVIKMIHPVFCHRMVLHARASLNNQTPEKILDAIRAQILVPAVI